MRLVTKVSYWVSVLCRHSPSANTLYIDVSGHLGEYGECLFNSLFYSAIQNDC